MTENGCERMTKLDRKKLQQTQRGVRLLHMMTGRYTGIPTSRGKSAFSNDSESASPRIQHIPCNKGQQPKKEKPGKKVRLERALN